MNDDVVRLSVVGQIIRRRWRVLAVVAVVGALLGYALSLVLSPGYQASAQVLLQGSRDPNELLTESQIAVSSVVLERASSTLGWDVPVTDLQERVTAEIVDGNVIEIRCTDTDADRARQLTDQVANEFVTYSSQLISNPVNAAAELEQEQQKTLQQQVKQANEQLSELHRRVRTGSLTVDEVVARTELEELRRALTAAAKQLEDAQAASTRTNAVVIEPASTPGTQAAPTALHLTAGGALAGFLLAMAGHLVAARGERRLRGADQIGSALGAPVVGQVEVAEEHVPGTGRWRGLSRLLCTDRPWQTPSGEVGTATRYRRLLGKLRGTHGVPLRLLVVVADDDPAGRAAAQRLVGEAAGEPHANGNGNGSANGNGHTSADPTLRLAEVKAQAPDVPEDSVMSGVLVVVSAGSRTGWELTGLTEASEDAGHRVVGVIVARPVRPRAAGETPSDAAAKDEELAGAS